MIKKDALQGELPGNREAYRTTLDIAIPAVLESVSIALMGMVNTVMVARIGDHAVAAVGLTQQPRMLLFSLFLGLNIAMTAIVARNMGAGNMQAARSCLRHSLMLQTIIGIGLTAVAVFLARPMMALAGAEADTIGLASSYFRITGYALIIQMLTMSICAAQRACGNTKITLRVNVTAHVLNVLLNFLLIEGRLGFPRLEVDGAAWSIVISAIVAFGLAVGSVIHRDSILRVSRNDNWRFEKPMLASITNVAKGSMLEQIGLRFGFLVYARVVAGLGTDDFAAHIVAQQFMVLSFTFAEGIGAATTALVGQNLGKKRPDLSIMYGKIGLRLAVVVATALSIACLLFRYQFSAIFLSDPATISTSATLILILALILPVQTSQLVMGGSLRGSGDTRYVALTMILCVGILRPLLAFIFTWPLGFGIIGAWITVIFDQLSRLIMLFTRFAGGKWIKTKI